MWYEMKIPTKRNTWKVVWNGECLIYFLQDREFRLFYQKMNIVPKSVMKQAVCFIKDHKRFGTRRVW